MSNIKRALSILEDYIKREAAENQDDGDVLHRCRDEMYIVDVAYTELKELQHNDVRDY